MRLVFDSQYDRTKGVVVYMRLLDGKICPGMKVKMMATGAEFQVLSAATCCHSVCLRSRSCVPVNRLLYRLY